MSTKFFLSTALGLLLVSLCDYCPAVAQDLAFSSTSISSIEGDSSKQSLTFQLSSIKRCMFGDLDALMLDIQRADHSSELQLTVEKMPLDYSSAFYGVGSKERATVAALGSYQVEIPKEDSPQIYGVFLCSVPADRSSPQSCSMQHVVGINDMLAPYRVDSSKAMSEDGTLQPSPLTANRKYKGMYKNYYFKFLLVEGNTVTALSDALNAEQYSQLHRFLSSKVGSKMADKAIANIKRYGETLGSLPLQIRGSNFQIRLPYYSRKKCLGISPK